MASPKAVLDRTRDRAPWFDHLVRAAQRYQADTGDRLAASVTFFGFLSFFPLLALSASLLAYFIGDDAIGTVTSTVDDYAPGLADQLGLQEILSNDRAAGIAGLASLAGLLFAGLGWVDALREAVRTVWHQNVRAGNFVKKKAVDVVILAGLGATLGLSLVVSAAAGAFTDVALRLLGQDEGGLVASTTVTVLGTVLAVATSTGLFLYLFTRLPKVETPWRRVFKGALLAAVLFEVLKRVGAIYIDRTTENPLYGAFAVVVGLLVWINLVSRMLLFCAAWTVTAAYDSDVAPSGTATPEQARKAGIPLEFADDDPDDPPTITEDGAPSPLLHAVQGAVPPQDVPQGRGATRESPERAARRATGQRSWAASAQDGQDGAHQDGASQDGAAPARRRRDGSPDSPLPYEAQTRLAGQVGAGLASAGLVAVAVYVLKTVWGVFRR